MVAIFGKYILAVAWLVGPLATIATIWSFVKYNKKVTITEEESMGNFILLATSILANAVLITRYLLW